MSSDDVYFQKTGHAIEFLQLLQNDSKLAHQCRATDLEGRLQIAADSGYDFSESDLRVAIRNWDYHGLWREWLSAGRISPSVEDLPPLFDSYPLTTRHVEQYQRDGHILLPGVLSPEEISAYRPVIRAAVERYNPENRAIADRDLQAFLLIVNLRVREEAARRFVLARRFAKIAADLMQVERVRIYLDEAFYKEPGGGKTQWHQDRLYFPLDTDEVVTLWMPIVDVTAQMGTLSFASGSHTEGDLGYQPISDAAEEYFSQFIEERGFTLAPSVDMEAGDATFHHGWVLHGAPPNTSTRPREVMTIVYYPDGTSLPKPNNIYQQRALELGFGGKSGDLAESPIHPVVYDSQVE